MSTATHHRLTHRPQPRTGPEAAIAVDVNLTLTVITEVPMAIGATLTLIVALLPGVPERAAHDYKRAGMSRIYGALDRVYDSDP